MPRIKRQLETPRSRHPKLVMELAQELTNERDFGQPLIEELQFPRTNNLQITVVWDRWKKVPYEDRSLTILEAFEQVEGKEYSNRIALAIGVTFPEAREHGLVPYRVVAHLRKDDPVTVEQCRQAFLKEGASLLFGKEPELRFTTQERAEACRARLVKKFPGTEEVWGVQKDLSPTTL